MNRGFDRTVAAGGNVFDCQWDEASLSVLMTAEDYDDSWIGTGDQIVVSGVGAVTVAALENTREGLVRISVHRDFIRSRDHAASPTCGIAEALESHDRNVHGCDPLASEMALRDHFAGQALSGVIQTCAGDPWAADYDSVEEMFAHKAYALADAMLAARNRKADRCSD